jgi:hypothetical protein
LAPFLGIKRNGLNKNFRDYGFDIVPADDPMAELRAALSSPSALDSGWSKRVFRGNAFNANTSEEQVMAIADAILANRRKVNSDQTLSPSESDWILQETYTSDRERTNEIMTDDDFLQIG